MTAFRWMSWICWVELIKRRCSRARLSAARYVLVGCEAAVFHTEIPPARFARSRMSLTDTQGLISKNLLPKPCEMH